MFRGVGFNGVVVLFSGVWQDFGFRCLLEIGMVGVTVCNCVIDR